MEVTEISCSSIASLSLEDAGQFLRETQQLIASLQAKQTVAICAVSRDPEEDWASALAIAPEIRRSPQVARNWIEFARVVMVQMPQMYAAMECGDLDQYSASRIVDVVGELSPEHVAEVDARMATRVAGRDSTQIRRSARDIASRVDPEGAAKRADARRKDRCVKLLPGEDSMATLMADLPAEVAATIYARLTHLARALKVEDKSRTMDQLRADVFTDALMGKHLGQPPVRAEVFLHMPLATALEMDDEPCFLPGQGFIPAHIAREIMNNPESTWRRVLTDDASGAVIDVGRTSYRPTAAITDHVRVGRPICSGWGCNRPAQACDLDHDQPWSEDGKTSTENLRPLCKTCHKLKDHPGWEFGTDDDTGELAITTPLGRTLTTVPEPLFPAVE